MINRFILACSLWGIASVAFAAPTITVTGGRLNRASNPVRVWNLAVAPDLNLDPTGTPLALELGFRASGGNILSVMSNPNPPVPPNPDGTPGPGGGPVEFLNPGNVIFGWETLTQLESGMFPVGLQVGTGADSNEAFAAVGTAVLRTSHRYDLLKIVTQASVTSLAWGGRYNADGSLAAVDAFVGGRIAQGEPQQDAVNFHGYSGTLPQNPPGATRFLADMNGDGNTNFGDLAAFGSAVLQPQNYIVQFPHLNRLARCDINGDGQCNFAELAPFGQLILGTGVTAAGTSLAIRATPEPSCSTLTCVAIGLVSALRRRSFVPLRTCPGK